MKFKLGTIVTLKSNGLLPLANHNFLSLGGNENFTTPLMVVIEILLYNNPEIDEESGEVKSNSKSQNKYKCLYFSNKSMKFEENWFAESELMEYKPEKLETNIQIEIINNKEKSNESVETDPKKKERHKLKFGNVVRFKTVDEEAKKTKSFNEGENKKGSKPLITFIAPAMQVVGFAQPEKKDQSLDPNTGKPKRVYPSKIVKCKFFNTESDKFSEQLVPIECLQYIDNSNLEQKLEEISEIKLQKSLTLIRTNDSQYFGSPNAVHVFSGRYQLSFYNELTKKQSFIWIDEIEKIEEVDFTKSQYYPGINDGTGVLTSISDFIDSVKDEIKGQHFKITYCNLKEKRVSRYITIKKLGNELEDKESIPAKNYFYLKSYCHLREADRDFRSDRILSIRTITDKGLNDFLTEKAK